MNLIEKLGLEKCKAVVERHRNLGTHFTKFKYYSVKKDDFFLSQLFIDFICVDDLRTAIADHERTDHCSDIANHISHLTEMREEFEKLHEIKIRLVAVFFNPKEKKYVSKNHLLSSCSESAKFINGSWLAWQHQQAKIDEGLKLIKSLYKSEFSQRSNADIHISQLREIDKALRGEHE